MSAKGEAEEWAALVGKYGERNGLTYESVGGINPKDGPVALCVGGTDFTGRLAEGFWGATCDADRPEAGGRFRKGVLPAAILAKAHMPDLAKVVPAFNVESVEGHEVVTQRFTRKVEFESLDFNRRYQATVPKEYDPVALRELFGPGFLAWATTMTGEIDFGINDRQLWFMWRLHERTEAELKAALKNAGQLFRRLQGEMDESGCPHLPAGALARRTGAVPGGLAPSFAELGDRVTNRRRRRVEAVMCLDLAARARGSALPDAKQPFPELAGVSGQARGPERVSSRLLIALGAQHHPRSEPVSGRAGDHDVPPQRRRLERGRALGDDDVGGGEPGNRVGRGVLEPPGAGRQAIGAEGLGMLAGRSLAGDGQSAITSRSRPSFVSSTASRGIEAFSGECLVRARISSSSWAGLKGGSGNETGRTRSSPSGRLKAASKSRRCAAPRTRTTAAGSATARSRTALAPASASVPCQRAICIGIWWTTRAARPQASSAGPNARITSKSQWTTASWFLSAISVTAAHSPRSASAHRVGTTSMPTASAASATGPGGPSRVASPPASTWRPRRRTHCQVEPPGSRLWSMQQTLSTPSVLIGRHVRKTPLARDWNTRGPCLR